jgi:hypothetical protein
LLVGCLCSAAFAAEPRPGDFTVRFDLVTGGEGPFFRVALTADVVRYSRSPALADLRVYNAAGEPVPFALSSPPAEEPPNAPVPLAVYPVAARVHAAAAAGGRLAIRSEGTATTVIIDGGSEPGAAPVDRVAAYLLDARAVKQLGVAIELDARFAAAQLVPINVEASRDLKTWHPLALGEPVYRLGNGDAEATRTSVRFARAEPLEGRFLRVTWPSATPFELIGATVATVHVERALPPDLRVELDAPSRAETHAFEWQVPTPVGITALEVRPAQANVVAPVTVFGRPGVAEPWLAIGRGVVYRIATGGVDTSSPPLNVRPGSYHAIKLVPDPGATLGDAPAAAVHSPARDLLFLARGGPFALVAGNADARPAALAPATLIPDYRPEAVRAFATATLGPAQVDASRVASPPRTLLGVDARTLLLWAILLGAVGLLAGFALTLLRKLKREAGGDSASR